MEWYVWITWWIVFCIRNWRLFWLYLKRHGEKTHNPSIRIYVNKKENGIIFKFKAGYYVELLTPESIKLLGSAKIEISRDENGKNAPHLENIEAELVHHNSVNSDYQYDSRVLYAFIPNKLCDQLLDVFLKKTFNSEFSYTEIWFTYQDSKPLEIEDKINNALFSWTYRSNLCKGLWIFIFC